MIGGFLNQLQADIAATERRASNEQIARDNERKFAMQGGEAEDVKMNEEQKIEDLLAKCPPKCLRSKEEIAEMRAEAKAISAPVAEMGVSKENERLRLECFKAVRSCRPDKSITDLVTDAEKLFQYVKFGKPEYTVMKMDKET